MKETEVSVRSSRMCPLREGDGGVGERQCYVNILKVKLWSNLDAKYNTEYMNIRF